MKEIKNPIFIKNCKDLHTNKFVKRIDRLKITKMGRECWHMVWQYYRDRKRKSVMVFYGENIDKFIKVIYFDDPKQYYYQCTKTKPTELIKDKVKDMVKLEKDEKKESYKIRTQERKQNRENKRQYKIKHKILKKGKPSKWQKGMKNTMKYSKEGREILKAKKKKWKEREKRWKDRKKIAKSYFNKQENDKPIN